MRLEMGRQVERAREMPEEIADERFSSRFEMGRRGVCRNRGLLRECLGTKRFDGQRGGFAACAAVFAVPVPNVCADGRECRTRFDWRHGNGWRGDLERFQ
jgi:hypothetical protein